MRPARSMMVAGVLLALSVGTANAVEGPLFEPAPDAVEAGGGQAQAVPAAPAKPLAIEFSWEQYRSVVVVGDGVGQMRPAWVATYEKPVVPALSLGFIGPIVGMFGYRGVGEAESEKLAVAYRAQAFLDADGHLHLDARLAVISGPQANRWSPDSFMFTLPDLVETVDDNHSANAGKIIRVVDPLVDAATYRTLLNQVQVVVGDGI